MPPKLGENTSSIATEILQTLRSLAVLSPASVKNVLSKMQAKNEREDVGEMGSFLCHGVLLPRVPAQTSAQLTYKEALYPIQEAHQDLLGHCELLASLGGLANKIVLSVIMLEISWNIDYT